MESETKFAPQWLQASQQNDSSFNCAQGGDKFFCVRGSRNKESIKPNGNGNRLNNVIKYQLAEHRYGREEMLALFDPSNTAPDDLRIHPIYIQESLNPISFTTMTEEEEAISLQSVNSYGFKPYLRGGMMRGGLRGEYRGRGRGRDEEGRLRPRDSWDDRPSKGHDYSGQGHDDGQTASHKTDFFSPSGHLGFNRSNSNESWRSRSHFPDADNNENKKDRWGIKNWRDIKIENKLQEESAFFKGTPPRDLRPVDYRRSKSLYEEDETVHKIPEWSTVDDDFGVEGSFDSSGAFMTSQLKNQIKKTSDASIKSDSKLVTETPDNMLSEKELKQGANDSLATDSNLHSKEDDNEMKRTTPFVSHSITINKPASEVESSSQDEKDLNVSFNNTKLVDLRANILHADGNMIRNIETEASSFVHPVPLASLPSAEQNMALTSSLVQPFTYLRNSWYYIDPQGAMQGPFKDSDMAEWCYQGYFDMALVLKAGETGEFMSLRVFVNKVGGLPFAPNRPPVQSQPLQNIPLASPSFQTNTHHPMKAMNTDVLPHNFYYPHQPLIPRIQHQLPMQNPEPLQNTFLPTLSLGVTNSQDSLFVPGSVLMPSLNGDINNKTTWNQNTCVLQDKSTPEVTFNNPLPQNSSSVWNSGLVTSSINVNPSSQHILDYAANVQPRPSVDYLVSQQLEKAETDRKKEEHMKMIDEMKLEKLKLEEAKRKKQLEDEDMRRQQELKAEKLRMDEERRMLEVQMIESLRQEESKKLVEMQKIENYQEEAFKPVEDSKKESKKRKEVKKQEELRRQEESKRHDMLRRSEEQKKAEEMKRKEEEESQRLFMEIAEEAKKKELNLRKLSFARNAWSSSHPQSSSKSDVLKITDIQVIEQEKMKKKQLSEQKLIAEQQKSSIIKTTGSIWSASSTTKSLAPKSLLDIQNEQASQLEISAKVPQQPQVVKKNEVIVHSSSRNVGKEILIPIIPIVPETSMDAAWETVGAPGLKKLQKHPALDNNQFPVLISNKPTMAGKKQVKDMGKSNRDEVAAQKVFEAVKVKDEITEWCEKALRGIETNVDISTLVDFLKTLRNSSEVEEYIHNYLGHSKQVNEFAKQFMEKSSNYVQENSSWSIVGRQSNSGSNKTHETATDKTNKKGKKKNANFLLGFTVKADPDRTNVGEIDTIPLIGSKK